jgi:thioredoxin reductase
VAYNSKGTPPAPVLDVVVVGGGPAGLNAALVLGRCRRNVVLCDAGRPRNAASRGVHGFLSRDGVAPQELRRIAREQLAAYPSVEVRETEVTDAACDGDGFAVTTADGVRVRSRKLLLATGTRDELPDIDGFQRFYGRGVYNCPYCDGWENRDRPIAVYGQGRSGAGFALELTGWSRDIILFTDGDHSLAKKDRARLERHGIGVVEEPIARLEGDGELERVRLASGDGIGRLALFFIQEEGQDVSFLIERLGCDLGHTGKVETGRYEKTNVPGLYVAGDASRRVQFAIVAAAEGAMAAFAINTELLRDDLA